jgi:hypothetical protein
MVSRSPLLSTPLLLALVAGLVALASPAPAQWDESGRFEVTIDGRPAGTEEFTIRRTGTGETAETTAIGRVQLRLATGSLDIAPRLRTTGDDTRAVAYQVEVGGDSPRTIVGTVGAGRFTARIQTATGEQMREYVASEGAVVLDDGVAHHYRFVAERAREGRIPVLIPRENRQVMVEVADGGRSRTTVAGQEVQARRLTLRGTNFPERHVWVDGSNRVLRVEIPSTGYLAVRAALPE